MTIKQRPPTPETSDFPERTSISRATNHQQEGEDSGRANNLNGRDWTRYSISIWDDIGWSQEERDLRHPARFPVMLVERLIQCLTRSDEKVIFDPFMGSGSTLLAAHRLQRQGIGIEIYEKYINLARTRLSQTSLFSEETDVPILIHGDSRNLDLYLEPESVDFSATSPPYWDIMRQKRTADYKRVHSYGDAPDDLGTISEYDDFLGELMTVFRKLYPVLKPNKYLVVNVMDLRKRDKFFPLHSDLSKLMIESGYTLDDIIIWDRRKDYNNFRSLGYPHVFRVNKAHEYLLIFQKR